MKLKKTNIIASILLTFLIMLAITIYEYKNFIDLTNGFVASLIERISEEHPEIAVDEIIDIINLEEYSNTSQILSEYGYSENDLSIIVSLENAFYHNILLNIVIFIIIVLLIILGIYFYNRKQQKELNSIINYLKELNRGNYDLKIELNSEGLLSILKNEIYTTTIMLKEQAEKEMNDKINLKDSLTNISHQLKTPLTSISLLIDNLCDNDVDPETSQEFLNDIKMQIESINYLIIALLKLSRFDANVITFKKENINAKQLCIDVLKHIDVIRDLKNITIHISGASDISFLGDYKWEFEALSNILKNCLEYTPENKNIYVLFSDNSIYTEIQIKDEGPGMSKEEQKHIFERFYKGPNSSNNSFGIGLSLAKEIITKDNGTIKVTSYIDQGTTFKIRYYK